MINKGMTIMYYDPNMYAYPYYANAYTPMTPAGYMSRGYQENDQEMIDAILSGIKREASAVDLYSRLVKAAPNEKHQHDILRALEEKRYHLNNFTNLYITMTGRQPEYQIDEIAFDSYREGVQKASESEAQGYSEYQRNYSQTPNPLVQNVFLHASSGGQRFEHMNHNALQDYGSQPFVVDIEEVTKENETFRTAIWTGEYLQVTLMSIDVGDDIGLELHPDVDQFIRIEDGEGLVQMGDSKDNLDFQRRASEDFAIMVPAGKWHNLTNTGNKPLKVYSIYAPPEHPFGTVHETKEDAIAAEEHHHY